jgi:hypothetical protein
MRCPNVAARRQSRNNHKARAFWTSLLDLTAAAGGGGRLLYARSGGPRLVVLVYQEGGPSGNILKPATCRLIRCRVARPWLRGLQCTHVRIRWHPTNGLEQELWPTHLSHDVCATTPARPRCPHPVIKHAFVRQISPAWRFRSGSRLGRRTPRRGTLPWHDLH